MAPRQGRESITWFSPQWVIQKRAAGAQKNVLRSQQILAPLAAQQAFQSAAGEIIASREDHFYLLSRRLPGQSLAKDKLRAWEAIEPRLEEIARIIQQLQKSALSPGAYLHPNNPVVLSLLAERRWIQSGLDQKLGVSVELPPEPQAPLFLGHGDLGAHNIIVANQQIFFVDWDTVSALPQYSDAAYLTQNILYRLDFQHWPKVLAASHVLADYLSFSQWVDVVICHLARSAVIWPNWHLGREGVLEKLPDILPQLYRGQLSIEL